MDPADVTATSSRTLHLSGGHTLQLEYPRSLPEEFLERIVIPAIAESARGSAPSAVTVHSVVVTMYSGNMISIAYLSEEARVVRQVLVPILAAMEAHQGGRNSLLSRGLDTDLEAAALAEMEKRLQRRFDFPRTAPPNPDVADRAVPLRSTFPPPAQGPGQVTHTVAVTIYLADEGIHKQVETAVEALLGTAGLQVEEWEEPIRSSWFRRMRAGVKQAVHSPAAQEAVLTATHAADSRLVLAQDAHVTATLLQNLGPVITSLQPTRDAALRIGALLIVKVDWTVQVFQLTAAQQAILDHRPELARSPGEIIEALQLSSQNSDSNLGLL